MRELYVSTDIETNGPVVGKHAAQYRLGGLYVSKGGHAIFRAGFVTAIKKVLDAVKK